MRTPLALLFGPLLSSVVLIAQSATTQSSVVPDAGSQRITAVSPTRDSQALRILATAITALGSELPRDSVAVGSVTETAGSIRRTGRITLKTRSFDQSAEHLVFGEETVDSVYSRGHVREVGGGAVKSPNSMEWDASGQAPFFPLALLAQAVSDSTMDVRLVGNENLNGQSLQHLQIRKKFTNPKSAHLSEFSLKDVFLDSSTGLPREIRYDRRAANGSAPSFPLRIVFDNYRSVSGVLYPFSITEYLNGTSWRVITLESANFDTGLSDTDFGTK